MKGHPSKLKGRAAQDANTYLEGLRFLGMQQALDSSLTGINKALPIVALVLILPIQTPESHPLRVFSFLAKAAESRVSEAAWINSRNRIV